MTEEAIRASVDQLGVTGRSRERRQRAPHRHARPDPEHEADGRHDPAQPGHSSSDEEGGEDQDEEDELGKYPALAPVPITPK
jgi:hypothetical protein